jgi:hypothetical protein
MSNEALKLELIDWLMKLENQDLLNVLKVVKDTNQSEDWAANLTEEQKEDLKTSMDQSNSGNLTSHQDVQSRFGI